MFWEGLIENWKNIAKIHSHGPYEDSMKFMRNALRGKCVTVRFLSLPLDYHSFHLKKKR